MSIKVILADDHKVVREGLKAVIKRSGSDITVVAEADNGHAVLEAVKKKTPDIYVLDISMPVLNGIETAKKLIKMDSGSKIIFLSMHSSRKFVERALKSGAAGYILKENATKEVVRAVHEVYNGEFYLSPEISGFAARTHSGKNMKEKKIVKLTGREREILQLIAEGFSAKEIAVRLRVSVNTAHTHKNNIMHKLNIHKIAKLIRYAINEGISEL